MATSKRIVLVDPLGEILFSGESLIARGPDIEPCPETKRSAESGVFRAVDGPHDASHDREDLDSPAEGESVDPDAEIATKKRGPRAA